MTKLLKTIFFTLIGAICMSTSCDEEEYPVTVVNETDNDICACIMIIDREGNRNVTNSDTKLIRAHNETNFRFTEYILEHDYDWYLMVITPEIFRENEFSDILENKLYHAMIKYNNRQIRHERHIIYQGLGQTDPTYRD